ncbi:unnamed protein product [Adineta ricciae]|uniref:Uncharacterized protein n=1 Tax=Adineta ricciae TaxID=249248 RepID=A0A815P5K6_ADIRI|nr:unnamed protein product [Adineta ricciae]
MCRFVVCIYVLLVVTIYTNSFSISPSDNKIQSIEQVNDEKVHKNNRNVIMFIDDQINNRDSNINKQNIIVSRINSDNDLPIDRNGKPN